ncbi:MAG: hypothetical protein ACI9C3_002346, partial [Yoonia sp.]
KTCMGSTNLVGPFLFLGGQHVYAIKKGRSLHHAPFIEIKES